MRTKIIATIGPASSSPAMLQRMAEAGMDVCRLNFSHGSHDQHKEVIETITEYNRRNDQHIALLADLQGPKIRLGDLPQDGIALHPGDRITFTTRENTTDKGSVFISYSTFAADVKQGETILVDDGKLALKVVSTNGHDEVLLESVNGGLLLSRKGVNLPETSISLPSLTRKDLEDLDFILNQGVQWVALSFVRSAIDIHILRSRIEAHTAEVKPRIVAKIEKPQAVRDIEAIVEASDAVMIARGDLGVEMPMQTVPMIQKKIIRLCQKAGKPVIVATQMMEAMIENIRPTRAEVNDVANSVLDGADALMLSGETSVGRYPVETIRTMQSIISQIEDYDAIYHAHTLNQPHKGDRFGSDAVLYNAVEMARLSDAGAIVVVTHSGYSAMRLASHRPKAKLLVFSNCHHILQTLNMVWGVEGFYDGEPDNSDQLMQRIGRRIAGSGLLKNGDYYIQVLSTPSWKKGASNTLRLGVAGEE
ncbi:MAG TPA: pyruvate kinase [Bacteroidales bacterium]|nr:pyruvate kinase [Bacteroidales bacterium]